MRRGFRSTASLLFVLIFLMSMFVVPAQASGFPAESIALGSDDESGLVESSEPEEEPTQPSDEGSRARIDTAVAPLAKASLSISLENAIGTYGGQATLSARVVYGPFGAEAPVQGLTAEFRVDGSTVGSAVTDADGVARLSIPLRMNAGQHALAVDVSGGSFTPTSKTGGTLTVGLATLTVRPDDKSKLYGQPNPTFTYSVTGLANGDTAAVISGPVTCGPTRDAVHVGTYTIRCSGGKATNYAIQQADGLMTVGAAPLTITTGTFTKTYGQPNPVFLYTVSGLVNGDGPSVVTGVTCGLIDGNEHAGGHVVRCSGGVAADYAISYVDGRLNVTPAPLTVTADNLTKVYGQPNPTFTATFTGLVNGDTPANISGMSCGLVSGGVHVGNYTIRCSRAIVKDYIVTYVDGTLAVTPAPLTVTADSFTKMYGQANPAFTHKVSGLVNGDSAAVVTGVNCGLVGDGTHVGSYAIQCGGGAASDYAISYVDGSLAVTPAPLTVTANNATKVYGQPNPPFTYAVSGLVNGDSPAVVTGVSCTALDDGKSITLAITCSGGVAANYLLSYVAGTLTVQVTTKPEATIRFDPVSKELQVFGQGAGVSSGALVPTAVVNAKWGDGKDDPKGKGDVQRRTYLVQDVAGHTLTLQVLVKMEGSNLQARVLSLQYDGGAVQTAAENELKFDWAIDKKSGALKQLGQHFKVDKGKAKQDGKADYDGQKDQSKVEVDGAKEVKVPGLVLLEVTTDQGSLTIGY